jgi:hypothetical protein
MKLFVAGGEVRGFPTFVFSRFAGTQINFNTPIGPLVVSVICVSI